MKLDSSLHDTYSNKNLNNQAPQKTQCTRSYTKSKFRKTNSFSRRSKRQSLLSGNSTNSQSSSSSDSNRISSMLMKRSSLCPPEKCMRRDKLLNKKLRTFQRSLIMKYIRETLQRASQATISRHTSKRLKLSIWLRSFQR